MILHKIDMLYIYTFIHLFIYPFICLFTHLSIYLSMYLCIYLSIHLYRVYICLSFPPRDVHSERFFSSSWVDSIRISLEKYVISLKGSFM